MAADSITKADQALIDSRKELKYLLRVLGDMVAEEDDSPFMSRAQPNEVGILGGKLKCELVTYLSTVLPLRYIESRYDSGESVLIIGL